MTFHEKTLAKVTGTLFPMKTILLLALAIYPNLSIMPVPPGYRTQQFNIPGLTLRIA
jgi:hypothetical protein